MVPTYDYDSILEHVLDKIDILNIWLI
jgi:hypothetical protein